MLRRFAIVIGCLAATLTSATLTAAVAQTPRDSAAATVRPRLDTLQAQITGVSSFCVTKAAKSYPTLCQENIRAARQIVPLAKAESILAVLPIPVPAPTPTPTPTPTVVTSIAVSVVRFDSLDTGTVLASSAIPLIPGLIKDTSTLTVRLFIGGVEVPIYVEQLQGRHLDGSARSILLQAMVAVKSSAPLTGTVQIGQQRLAGMTIAKPSGGRSLPVAGILPTDPKYLMATDVVGPTLTSAQTDTMGDVFAQYDTDFAKWSDYQWTQTSDDWASSDYYDRALIYYAQWVRTGNPTYWYRGNRLAVNYRKGYVEPNNGRLSAYWSQMEGLEKHYILTGDDSSRAAIGSVSSAFLFADGAGFHALDSMQLGQDPQWAYMDDRLRARVVMIALLAYRVNAAGDGGVVYAAKLDTALNRITNSLGATDGMHRYGLLCNGSLNYMQGQLNDALIKTFVYYKPDPRILPFVKASTDYLWTRWLPAAGSFEYLSGANDSYASPDGTCQDKGGPGPASDLDNMMVNGFGFVYQQTHDQTYLIRGDSVFAAGVHGSYLIGSKQFNQAYTSSFLYLSLRRTGAAVVRTAATLKSRVRNPARVQHAPTHPPRT